MPKYDNSAKREAIAKLREEKSKKKVKNNLEKQLNQLATNSVKAKYTKEGALDVIMHIKNQELDVEPPIAAK